MKNHPIRRNLRATGRFVAGLALMPLILGAVVLQGLIVGPVLRDRNTLPTAIYNTFRRLLGIKIEFNAASAPIEDKKPTWFVANHMSMADFVTLGSTLKGTFAGKGDILSWPGVAQAARAVKYIGIKRVKKDDPNFKKFHRQTIGKIMSNFNNNQNTIMFPEGTTTDGNQVAMFRAGLISMLFGQNGEDEKGNEITLNEEVVVQPVAIRVKDVEGKDASGEPELINRYSYYEEDNMLTRIWKRLQTKDMTIELTVFPPMHPADYTDQFELINDAGDMIRDVVAPHQTEVNPAVIPGVDKEQKSQPRP